MSLSAFLQPYIKPSRWWRRKRSIQVTIWPQFLAQALCPHARKSMIMFDVENRTKTSMCLDCYKHIEETNDCEHGEVRVSVMETVGGQLVPRGFRCEHCSVELEVKDLPRGVRIAHLNMGSL